MKQVIPFYKEIVFKSNIANLTSISLEHTEKILDGEISGEFIVYGDYKEHNDTTEKESFKYKLPFTAEELEDVLIKGKEVLPNIEQYRGLELVWALTPSYNEPYWERVEPSNMKNYYKIPLTEEQYNLCKSAKIVSVYTNPNHNSYYESETWLTQFVALGWIDQDYLNLYANDEELVVAECKYDGSTTYYLCATEEYYTKYIEPNINSAGTAFYFYG